MHRIESSYGNIPEDTNLSNLKADLASRPLLQIPIRNQKDASPTFLASAKTEQLNCNPCI
jgi:hypothetical protein